MSHRIDIIRMVLLCISINVGLKSQVPSGLGDFLGFYNVIYFVKDEYDFFMKLQQINWSILMVTFVTNTS